MESTNEIYNETNVQRWIYKIYRSTIGEMNKTPLKYKMYF